MDNYIPFRKTWLSLIIIFMGASGLRAQTDSLAYPEQFLLPDFVKGRIVMKGGKSFDRTMNYNIVSEKIVLFQEKKIFDLANNASIDTIYFPDRKFVPAGKVFFELLAERPFLLYIQHKARVTEPAKMDSYGKIPQTASASAKSLLLPGYQSNNSVDHEFIISKEEVYWVKIDKSMESFSDVTGFVKIFPKLKAEIKLYIRQNKLRFENPGDIQKLMIYCKSLM